MVYLFLGKDDYTKKRRLGAFAVHPEIYSEDIDPADLAKIYLSDDLFSSKKLIVVYGALSKAGFADIFFDKISASGGPKNNELVFIEDALDKRKKETKQLLARSDIKVEEFEIPREENLAKWIAQRAKEMGLNVSRDAVNVFIQRLGENYNLWLVDSELRKLKTFAGEREVSAHDVLALVSENIDEDIFAVTNAIGDKNKALAVKLLMEYFDKIGGDEKGKIISLSAILSEQFRGVLIVKDLAGQNMPEAQIAKEMDFTPGRVFIYKKLAQRFTEEKLLDALKKFEVLDEEVKTSNGPASLQFFMIIEGLMR